jgi:SMC interacting uncharacterized protein involved in chromosome segregation
MSGDRDLRSAVGRVGRRHIDAVLEDQILPLLIDLSQAQTEAAMKGAGVNEKLADKYADIAGAIKDLTAELRKNEEDQTKKLGKIIGCLEEQKGTLEDILQERRAARIAVEARAQAEQDRLEKAEDAEAARQRAEREFALRQTSLENAHEVALADLSTKNEIDKRRTRTSLLLAVVPLVATAVSAIWGVGLWLFTVFNNLPSPP